MRALTACDDGHVRYVTGSVILLLVSNLMVSCAASAGSPKRASESGTTSPASTAWQQPRCNPPSPVSASGLGELKQVQGTATAGHHFWILVEATGPPLPVRKRVKLIIHLTGTGPFSIFADGPDDDRLGPQQGPISTLGSDWQAPGDEWISEWTFDKLGCWAIRVLRPGVAGSALLEVTQ